MEEKKGLKKNLGVATAMAIVVGCVIGSGVFFKPQAIYTATGGAPGLGMIAWIITGLASIAACLVIFAVLSLTVWREDIGMFFTGGRKRRGPGGRRKGQKGPNS